MHFCCAITRRLQLYTATPFLSWVFRRTAQSEKSGEVAGGIEEEKLRSFRPAFESLPIVNIDGDALTAAENIPEIVSDFVQRSQVNGDVIGDGGTVSGLAPGQ